MSVQKRHSNSIRSSGHPAIIKSIIEGRMNVEKYLERKREQHIL
jgi:hypothetical protein